MCLGSVPEFFFYRSDRLPATHQRLQESRQHESGGLFRKFASAHVDMVTDRLRKGSSPAASVVFVGRNRNGSWIAREQNGLFGGLFVSRAQALKYALFQNGNRRDTVVEVPREIELDISINPANRP